jgi:lactate dehydrogenase-like 2-hydroxyacid dehydrogenase
MKRRVFATADIGSEALDRLRETGCDLEVWREAAAPPASVLTDRVSGGAEVLVTTLRDRVDRALLEAGRGSLLLVAQDAVGLDNVDVEAATDLGIPVAHTPGVLTEATAEFAIFMMGALARRLEPSERLVREGRWVMWHPSEPFLGDEVTGKCLAVLGVGRIGRAVATRALGLDMDLLLCEAAGPDDAFLAAVDDLMRRRHDAGFSRCRRSVRWVEMDEALAEADFVSLHVPLLMPGEADRPTYRLIDDRALEQMKRTAYLVNTSRGPVVDEAALARALRSGSIAGAALDVYEKEPLPADSPLLAEDLRDRLRLYHHFGSGTRETRLSPDPDRGMAGRCVDAVIRILEGEDPAGIPWIANGREIAARRVG